LEEFQSLLPNGKPWINTEFYSGWLDYWGSPHNTVQTGQFAASLDKILSLNASVNIYMYHVGTNFGFTSVSDYARGKLSPVRTSYDYDGHISEAGDHTEKFFETKKVVGRYFSKVSSPSLGNILKTAPKMSLPKVNLLKLGTVFELLP